MPPAPPSDRELDTYREQADRFIAELDEEFYLHYAGLKDTFDLTPIYERHANLTELEQVQSIGLAVNGGARVRELWRFACEGHFGDHEGIADALAFRPASAGAAAFFQNLHEMGMRCLQSWEQAKKNARDRTRPDDEKENAPVKIKSDPK